VSKRPVEFGKVRFFDLIIWASSLGGLFERLKMARTAIFVARVFSCNLNMFSIPNNSPLLAVSPWMPSKYLTN
jgi:hypothetical protein